MGEPQHYDVVVLGFRLNVQAKPAAILEEIFGFEPERARELVRRYPAVIFARTTQAHAEIAAEQLREAGARVEVRPSEKPSRAAALAAGGAVVATAQGASAQTKAGTAEGEITGLHASPGSRVSIDRNAPAEETTGLRPSLPERRTADARLGERPVRGDEGGFEGRSEADGRADKAGGAAPESPAPQAFGRHRAMTFMGGKDAPALELASAPPPPCRPGVRPTGELNAAGPPSSSFDMPMRSEPRAPGSGARPTGELNAAGPPSSSFEMPMRAEPKAPASAPAAVGVDKAGTWGMLPDMDKAASFGQAAPSPDAAGPFGLDPVGASKGASFGADASSGASLGTPPVSVDKPFGFGLDPSGADKAGLGSSQGLGPDVFGASKAAPGPDAFLDRASLARVEASLDSPALDDLFVGFKGPASASLAPQLDKAGSGAASAADPLAAFDDPASQLEPVFKSLSPPAAAEPKLPNVPGKEAAKAARASAVADDELPAFKSMMQAHERESQVSVEARDLPLNKRQLAQQAMRQMVKRAAANAFATAAVVGVVGTGAAVTLTSREKPAPIIQTVHAARPAKSGAEPEGPKSGGMEQPLHFALRFSPQPMHSALAQILRRKVSGAFLVEASWEGMPEDTQCFMLVQGEGKAAKQEAALLKTGVRIEPPPEADVLFEEHRESLAVAHSIKDRSTLQPMCLSLSTYEELAKAAEAEAEGLDKESGEQSAAR